MAHVRQPRPDYGLGFQAKVLSCSLFARKRPCPDRGCAVSQGRTFCFFFVTLDTGPRRPSSPELSDTKVFEPYIRARLGTAAHFCKVGQNQLVITRVLDSFTSEPGRCRANIAHIRQPRPDSGLGFQAFARKRPCPNRGCAVTRAEPAGHYQHALLIHLRARPLSSFELFPLGSDAGMP